MYSARPVKLHSKTLSQKGRREKKKGGREMDFSRQLNALCFLPPLASLPAITRTVKKLWALWIHDSVCPVFSIYWLTLTPLSSLLMMWFLGPARPPDPDSCAFWFIQNSPPPPSQLCRLFPVFWHQKLCWEETTLVAAVVHTVCGSFWKDKSEGDGTWARVRKEGSEGL